MRELACWPSIEGFPGVHGLEDEIARLRRQAVVELSRPEAPGAKRRAIQLLKAAARLDTRARLLRAGES
jgi:hypothetical protein